MIDCEEVRALMAWYVEGTLDGDESRAVAAHLSTCSECIRELADMLRLRTELAAGFDRLPRSSDGLWKKIRSQTQGRAVARLDVGSFVLGFTMGASLQKRSLPVRGDLRVLGRDIRLFDLRKKGGRK
jgi:hypothetical protein